MKSQTIHVNLGERGYDIVVTSDDKAGLSSFLKKHAQGNLIWIVTDENIAGHVSLQSLIPSGIRAETTVLPPGENQKSLDSASKLYDVLASLGADRKTLVVALGGGVIGDLAGFVAATYNRGLSLLIVPTTLLAMVDSSIGGKVGVNHPSGKNLIGAFHQPAGVWIDSTFLRTLPAREFRSGLAEVVKYGVALNSDLFKYLETNSQAILDREPGAVRHVIARCCRLKAGVVEKDEREVTGLRMVLNYGHTFAHAFETASGYAWLHGEAVAAGMICASRLAESLGLLDKEITERQVQLLEKFGLPTRPEGWAADDLVRIMKSDKKTLCGKLRFILPRQIGEVGVVEDVPEVEVVRILT